MIAMQEYSRKIFVQENSSLNTSNDDNDEISFDLHKSTTVERQEANRAKGLSFGSISKEVMNSFSMFWERLMMNPELTKEVENTPLSQLIVKEEGAIYENDFLRSLLSETLQLDQKSPELKKALHACTKIYHEDYLGSYVLVYKGKRLGICFLSILKGVQNTVEVSYQFNPHMTYFN